MLLRLGISLAVLAAAYLVYLLWRRPPRRLAQLDLSELGVAGPAIVQFSTTHCAPCRRAVPSLREAARLTDVTYAHIDLDERPEIARRYAIRTVPTIVVARAGGDVLDVWTELPANGEIVEAARRAHAS